MDADQRPMTPDAELDDGLRALFAVDPSAHFAARVRVRIANDPAAHVSWFLRVFAVATAGAVVIAAVIVTRLASEAPTTAGRPAVAIALRRSPPDALLDARPLRPFAPIQPVPSVQPHQPLRPVRPRHEPEIMIDAREVAALRALIHGAASGQIDLRPVVAATTQSVMELSPIDDVAIAPIVIDPIEEGARQ